MPRCAPRDSRCSRLVGGPVSGDSTAVLAWRMLALDATEAVLSHREPLDDAFRRHLILPGLGGRDRAFAFHLASTMLRRLGQIEALIDACLARPLPRRPVPVRSLLRLGAAQLVFLRTAHAVVHTAVELARRPPAGSHAALIDAVLRRLAREGARWAETQDAARLNTPDWLWHSWAASYSGAVARSIAQIHLAEPPLT